VSPDGKRLYITALGVVGPVPDPVADGRVRGFAIAPNGALTEISRTDFGFDPVDLAFGGDGQHLYIADFSSDSITVFALSASGRLRPVQTVKSQGPNPGFQGVTIRRTTG
jgi:6-phosphogluconolactonase (cycloisomerase 2 family)